jgi:hypothetical protein
MDMAMRTRHLLAAGVILAGCATQGDEGAGASFSLVFAAIQDCTATPNGSGQVPANVDRLVLKWANGEGKTGSDTIQRGSVTKGNWLVKLPATTQLDIDVYGCDKDKKVVWRGRSTGLQIELAKDTKARIFLSPIAALTGGQLACAGGATGNGSLQSGRSLAGGAVLASGDVAIVGGIKDWTGSKQIGGATTAVDVFDDRLGTFRKGPDLAAARIQPHVHAVGPTQVLVIGGISNVVGKVAGEVLPIRLMAPADLTAAIPSVKAELLDISADSGKTLASKADVGVGALPYSSSIHLGTDLLFAGGLELPAGATQAQGVAKATRLGNLDDVRGGGPGASKTFDLKAARIRPGILKFGDGTALLWGGNPSRKVEDIGEIIGPGATTSDKLTVTGDAAILGNAFLATIGPAAVTLAQTDDTLTFLVLGGVPIETPVKAVDAPSYVVIVTKSAKTAEIKAVALSAGTLHAGLGTTAVQLPGKQVLIAGGLVNLQAVPGLCDSGAECILSSWLVLQPPVSTSDAVVTLQVVASGQLAAPRFGMTGLPLPAAALLAGGQSSVVTDDTDAVLDTSGRIVTVAPDDQAGICGP